MNKYEAAIAYFKERKETFAAVNFEDEAVEHINTAIEAIQKQVPRSLALYDGDGGECRVCDTELAGEDNYCTDCGQRISRVLTECIAMPCRLCGMHTADGPVCECYACKVDEIRRIHEEAST